MTTSTVVNAADQVTGISTSSSSGMAVFGYTVDQAGVVTAGTGQTDTYNAAGELSGQTEGSDSYVYTYTAGGQRASTLLDGTTYDTYSYSRAGALASVKALTTTSTYSYDGDGLRTAAVKTVGKTTTSTAFTWDSQTGSIPVLLSDGVNDYVYGLGDHVIEQAPSLVVPPPLDRCSWSGTGLAPPAP